MKARLKQISIAGLIIAAAIWVADWFLPVSYVARQATFQAELLWGRVDNDTVLSGGTLSKDEQQRLLWVPEIKAFGQELGLSATDNYDTINPTFDRTIWNVSACDPLSFSPKKWWFPIVGSVPYLGFFTRQEADVQIKALQPSGLDTHLRTAGAYSTLGWFRDPLLPNMLKWSEYSLSNTLLHELAHATVWIPGSVQFNESFANFVGDIASMRYMERKYGEQSDQVQRIRRAIEDRRTYRGILVELYQELDALYQSPQFDPDEKLREKQRLFATLPRRIGTSSIHNKAHYQRVVTRNPWNNARMMQFRTYNRSREWFQAVLDEQGGDLAQFMSRVQEITADSNSPYKSLEDAVNK